MGYKAGERRPTEGLGPRECITCGGEFQPYRSNQKTCSRACYNQTPERREDARVRQARPEVRERERVRRALNTSPYPDKVRRYNLRNALSKYGVTIEWYEQKLAEQGGACALCGHVPPPDGIKAASRLHVDHNHKTGITRDLLCTRCNMGVGYFMEDPALMRRAAEYIERHLI